MWCISGRSCYDSTISTIATIGDGAQNYNGTVYCGGLESCAYSRIYNVSTLYATAWSALYHSQIYGVSNIYVYGGVSPLNAAKIYSNGIGTMNIYLDSYEAGDNVTINCDFGDYCYIRCLTSGSCRDSTLINCFGTCDVDCDDSLGCPEVIVPTPAPTPLPTISGMTLSDRFDFEFMCCVWSPPNQTCMCGVRSGFTHKRDKMHALFDLYFLVEMCNRI